MIELPAGIVTTGDTQSKDHRTADIRPLGTLRSEKTSLRSCGRFKKMEGM